MIKNKTYIKRFLEKSKDFFSRGRKISFNCEINKVDYFGNKMANLLLVEQLASKTIQDLKFSAKTGSGAKGNFISIEYIGDGESGNEIVTVGFNSIVVKIESAVSTATQVLTKILASVDAMKLISCELVGVGETAQVIVAKTMLEGGIDIKEITFDYGITPVLFLFSDIFGANRLRTKKYKFFVKN